MLSAGLHATGDELARGCDRPGCRTLSDVAGTKCWDCGSTVHMTPIAGAFSVKWMVLRVRVQGCFKCDGCGALNIAVATGLLGSQDPLTWLTRKKQKEWLPQPPPVVQVPMFPDVPVEIASAAAEAYRCQKMANGKRAAILLARSVIEATAKDKGITRGTLVQKIDKMHDQRLIRPVVRDEAHEVRYFGNDMAHGDFAGEPGAQETDLVLSLMSDVLAEVYHAPAVAARAKAKREARKLVAAAAAEGKQLFPGLEPEQQLAFLALNQKLSLGAGSAQPERAPGPLPSDVTPGAAELP